MIHTFKVFTENQNVVVVKHEKAFKYKHENIRKQPNISVKTKCEDKIEMVKNCGLF